MYVHSFTCTIYVHSWLTVPLTTGTSCPLEKNAEKILLEKHISWAAGILRERENTGIKVYNIIVQSIPNQQESS